MSSRRINFFVGSAFLITTVLVLLLLSEVYGRADEGSVGEDEYENLRPSTAVALRWTPSITYTMSCNEDADREVCDHTCRGYDNEISGDCRNGRCECWGPSTQGCVDGGTGLWTVSTTFPYQYCASYQDYMWCDFACVTSNAFVGMCRNMQCQCCGSLNANQP